MWAERIRLDPGNVVEELAKRGCCMAKADAVNGVGSGGPETQMEPLGD